MPKIYLSPSNRHQNKCICGDNEFLHSRDYIEYLAKFLEAGGADVRINGSNLQFGVKESNIWGADIYYTVRTSPQRSRRGSVIYIGKDGNLSEVYRCAALIKKQRKIIYTGKVMINAVKRFYEASATDAICICDEIISHSNIKEAKFFHKNMKEMAKATADGILDYIKYTEIRSKIGEQTEECPKPAHKSVIPEISEKDHSGKCTEIYSHNKKDTSWIYECCADEFSQGRGLAGQENMLLSDNDFAGYLFDEEEELISDIGPFPEDNGEYISILP